MDIEEETSHALSTEDLAALLSETANVKSTAIRIPQQVVPRTWAEVHTDIQQAFKLNRRQQWCFQICANHFRTLMSQLHGATSNLHLHSRSSNPLQFLMTGPGGTGKTHTIGTFQQLMGTFNCAHLIHFLAPTGATAVNLPGGQTIHKACGIQVYDNSKSGRHALWLSITPEKKAELRSEWKGIHFLLIDEISMVGSSLLADLDLTLRCVCEVDDWSGGINVIFTGNFFQLPPVSVTPLYRPILKFSKDRWCKRSGDEARSRHGRIAWKQVDTVIELMEQKRMEADPEYADAVLRLRADRRFECMVAIVEWNKTRMALNSAKAIAATTGPGAPVLLSCMARHTVGRTDVAAEIQPICCQHESTTLPAELQLYIGAPVILKVCYKAM